MYKKFADIYDILMRNVDYKTRIAFITKTWKTRGISPKLVLDLGCGTGEASILLSKKGYDVIGVDSSPEMLSYASEKAIKNDLSILFLNQNMMNLELYGTVDSIISLCDSLNYILETKSLKRVFELAHNYLNDRGVFIFDMNTKYKYKKLLAQNTFAENNKRCSYIWKNIYDSDTNINEYELTLFIKSIGNKYEKAKEYHYQRAYGKKKLERLLRLAGFIDIELFDGYTFKKPHKRTERVVIVCRKKCLERVANDKNKR